VSSENAGPHESRRIYLLYPDRILKDEVAPVLLRNQYETYLVQEHDALARIIQPGAAIVYINIDEGLSEPEWQRFIAELVGDHSPEAMPVGVLSHDSDRVESWKRSELPITAGSIPIQSGITAKLMLRLLERFEARGRRKYVRARCADAMTVTFNVRTGESLQKGRVLDISVAGMTCEFEGTVTLAPNTYLQNILITAKDLRCSVSGTVLGTAHDKDNIYVIIFDKSVSSTDEEKLHQITGACLQASITKQLREAKS
jgi:hypothetical protein